MNLLIENGTISEVHSDGNFIYVLSDNSRFLSTEYKVLQNQRNSRFAKSMRILYNGHIGLFYLVNGFLPLSSILLSIDPNRFMTIAGNLLTSIIEVKKNGFLYCPNIDISFEHIFVDTNTYDVRLVYLPVNKHEYDDVMSFESSLRTSLVKAISTNPRLSSSRTNQFMADCQNGMLSLVDLNARTGINNGSTNDKKAAFTGKMELIAIDAPRKFTLTVNAAEFSIGKKSNNDGVIPYNDRISRNHCKILRVQGQYFVLDNHSLNGTFVNGEKIPADRQKRLQTGDILRLADSSFKVNIEE